MFLIFSFSVHLIKDYTVEKFYFQAIKGLILPQFNQLIFNHEQFSIDLRSKRFPFNN